MHLLITEQILGDINTISIPTDAILTVSLLIIFVLIGYLFNNILSANTNQFAQEINANSNPELLKEELEDRLELEVTKLDQKKEEDQRIKKLNFLPPAKLLGIGSLAVVSMGVASLVGLQQNMQKSYEGMSSYRGNIKLENESTKTKLSVIDLKSFYKTQKNIKTIRYIDPVLSTIKSSKDTHDYQVKEKQINNIFSF